MWTHSPLTGEAELLACGSSARAAGCGSSALALELGGCCLGRRAACLVLSQAGQAPAAGVLRPRCSGHSCASKPHLRCMLVFLASLARPCCTDAPSCAWSSPCPRVLIFLEALALGRPPPAFGVHLLPQLLAAAQHLGLRDLEVGWSGGMCCWVGRSAHEISSATPAS